MTTGREARPGTNRKLPKYYGLDSSWILWNIHVKHLEPRVCVSARASHSGGIIMADTDSKSGAKAAAYRRRAEAHTAVRVCGWLVGAFPRRSTELTSSATSRRIGTSETGDGLAWMFLFTVGPEALAGRYAMELHLACLCGAGIKATRAGFSSWMTLDASRGRSMLGREFSPRQVEGQTTELSPDCLFAMGIFGSSYLLPHWTGSASGLTLHPLLSWRA